MSYTFNLHQGPKESCLYIGIYTQTNYIPKTLPNKKINNSPLGSSKLTYLVHETASEMQSDKSYSLWP